MMRFFQAVENFIQSAKMCNPFAADEPATQSVGNGFRLLTNFLEHVMRKAIAFNVTGLPFNPFRLAGDRLVGQRINDILIGPNGHNVVVFQIHHSVSEAEESGDIACQEYFILPDAKHHGQAPTSSTGSKASRARLRSRPTHRNRLPRTTPRNRNGVSRRPGRKAAKRTVLPSTGSRWYRSIRPACRQRPCSRGTRTWWYRT